MLELIQALCAPAGVSGDECAAAKVAVRLLSPLGRCEITPLGSVLCRLPPKHPGLPRVMLTAHLDRIGLMVTRITDKGFLRVAPCGGVDRRSLSGARVSVHTASGVLPGVICAIPPHLSDGSHQTLKAEEAAVDVGFSAERARALIAMGDRITLDGPVVSLLGGRICGAALDDRAGCAAVIRAAQLLRDTERVELAVALVVQEEINSCGAATAAFSFAPDAAVAVDVSMGLTPDDKPELCGLMGDGPMIGVNPVLNRAMSRALAKTAQREQIPFQMEVMGGKTGTDCDAIAVAGAGVRTALVSIPLRFMHTPCESIMLSDAEDTARLIAAAIEGGSLVC